MRPLSEQERHDLRSSIVRLELLTQLLDQYDQYSQEKRAEIADSAGRAIQTIKGHVSGLITGEEEGI